MGALTCATTQPNSATHHHDHRVSPPNSAQRGITPAFSYGPRLGPVRLDFHQQVLYAARRTLRRLRPTRAFSRRRTYPHLIPLAKGRSRNGHG